MASYTPNYNLKKPADADSYDIADANGNMDIIDGALDTLNGKITPKSTGNLNTATEAGKYHYTGGASNSPDANYSGSVEVIPASNNLIYQFAIDTTNNAYTRVYKNSAWTSWEQLEKRSRIIPVQLMYAGEGISEGQLSVSESIKNFYFILIKYRTNAQEISQLVHTDLTYEIFQNVSLFNSTGQGSDYSYKASCTINFTSNTQATVSCAYNNANLKLRVMSIYGVIRK